ncbi:MAG: TlpA family protein disulfide reductase [Anaerolineaceae bacterium]|nr:TlpA family protein disulfide reductase [Anaerolineaceae bacterium]
MMKKYVRITSFILLLALMLAACAPAANNDMMKNNDMDAKDEEMTEPMDDMSALPDWGSLESVNVNTGETFTLADYSGKVVLVETLAMWCSSCYAQQQQVQALHEILGDRDDFVSIGMDIDINETPEDLAAYTATHGFDWVYTVASKDLARGIANEFGAQFLNPPLTPIFLIGRDGDLVELPFGIKNAEDLEAVITPLLDQMN